ncbi:transportin-2 [Aulographum hederae CBS 113979]|uniref:Transportin-2 n=1 Tax=Aulographum hederae CBS 113979 TaxID=1176131 RepID=A0A6G1H0P0_9PEZI|nr:transportin-2 [Aulographum hederae CBS 113979]
MAWQPQEEPLRQLAIYLKDSLSGHDKGAQKNAELMLKNAKSSPDFTNYLAYLFCGDQAAALVNMPIEGYHAARSAAAIMLKNDIKTSYRTMPEANKTYVRSIIVQGLQDPATQIRSYTGNVITELVKQGGIMGWPQILSELISLVENKSGSIPSQTQEGAMGALGKICEDNKRQLDRDYHNERPLNFIFPKLLEFTTSPLPKVRASALSSINIFLPEKPQAVMLNLNSLLQQLFKLAGDDSNDVKKQVCRCFIHIAEISPELVVPHMPGLVDYMVTQQRNPSDPELALDAAEFWLCLGEDDKLRPCLEPHLAQIVPVLLESMVYSEDDIYRLEAEAEDADEEDREQDIKPTFATSKSARLGPSANAENGSSQANGAAKSATDSLIEDDLSDGEIEDDDDDDDDEYGDPEDMWNLRKCSAAALDVLASVFHEPVFEVTLPYLKQNLDHSEWPNREAAVLALGAIADGCMDVVQPHLPDLTQYLLMLLSDKQPVVRQITCWSLGRYSSWAAHAGEAGREQYFVPIMDGILRRMLDGNKRVQEAAASAFANLEEKANVELKPYCAVIVQQFVQCFARYKDRNMFILYDCVQTLAEHVGPALAQPAQIEILMPALLQRYKKVSDQSREMFPLLECLSYVATALTDHFAPYSKPIFDRCISIIQQNLEDSFQAQTNPGMDLPEKDFLVTSLDLLSAIIQALHSSQSVTLVASSQPNLFELLPYCLNDASNDVRQSAYALLGDCAIYVFPQMQPHLPKIMQLLIAQMDLSEANREGEDSGYSVINNACWSAGEIGMREKEGMRPYVENLLQKLATILFSSSVPDSVSENAAIALGRLGLACSHVLAPHLAQFAPQFIKTISNVPWTDEKGHALNGFAQIVLRNPQAMEQCIAALLMEMARAPDVFLQSPTEIRPLEPLKSVYAQYKAMIPEFGVFINQNFAPGTLQALERSYGI